MKILQIKFELYRKNNFYLSQIKKTFKSNTYWNHFHVYDNNINSELEY